MLGKQKVKYIQSLGQKKLRDEEDLFIAEGPKIVGELLESAKENVQQVYALKEWIETNKDVAGKTAIIEITEDELGKISQLNTPNKVLAVVKKFDSKGKIEVKGKISLALDTIQDPGNLGTIIRIADWFGIQQVICSNNCADIYNPKVVQATMGSIARVKIFYVDLAEWLSLQKDIRIYAAVLEGQDVISMNKIKEGIIVIGNESKGISDEVMNAINVKVTIPKKGKADSLNAAVATGIILSHLT